MRNLLKKGLMALVTATTLITSAVPTMAGQVARYDAANTNTINAITLNQDNSYTLDINNSELNDAFEANYVYSFTLANPAIVTLTASANVYKRDLNKNVYVYLSDSTTFSSDELIRIDGDNSSGSKVKALDAGTYYVKTKLIHTGDVGDATTSPTIGLRVDTRDEARTGGANGNSYATAIPTTSGEVSHGIITAATYAQYFKIVCSETSDVSVDVALADKDIFTNLNDVVCKLTDEMGKVYSDELGLDRYSNKEELSGTVTASKLEKGTYYLVVSHKSAKDNGSKFASINVKPTVTTAKIEKLKAPKLKSYKKGSKKIKGTAVAGSTVTIQIKNRKKTFKVGSNGKFTIKLSKKLKKGQKIKVKAKMDGYESSKTVTYKVK